MIGNGYWAVGITVWHSPERGWRARVEYKDDGFVNDRPWAGQISTEGVLETRYWVDDSSAGDGLTVAVDLIKADAERLGITWKHMPEVSSPTVYYDENNEDYLPPDGWHGLMNAQAVRLGWPPYYTVPAR